MAIKLFKISNDRQRDAANKSTGWMFGWRVGRGDAQPRKPSMPEHQSNPQSYGVYGVLINGKDR
ncbi:hypothetical protein ACIPF8_13835 [Collimonas sp. NPDC087041]|uniref:hypothetical protein n=1 Tax=Collimonas sp. NPDC087041 TaxID=3363960 RepID=UPI00380DD2F9